MVLTTPLSLFVGGVKQNGVGVSAGKSLEFHKRGEDYSL